MPFVSSNRFKAVKETQSTHPTREPLYSCGRGVVAFVLAVLPDVITWNIFIKNLSDLSAAVHHFWPK